jgi:hypothetical protein
MYSYIVNSKVELMLGRKRPGGGGIPVAQTGIPLARDGTKNVPCPYKHLVINIIEIYTSRDPIHCPVAANVPSRLSYKQPLSGLYTFPHKCPTYTVN